MNMHEIKAMARQRGIKPGNMNKAELIRTIQREEGNSPCYNTGKAEVCGQTACLWRDDCH